MKEEKGFTLLSLITYIIVLLVVISIVTLVTNFLISNRNEMQENSKNISEINKFDFAFLKDIKQEEVSVYQISEDKTILVLEYDDGKDVQYIYQENCIYRVENGVERIKISENIEKFEISSQEKEITLILKVEGQDQISKHYKLGRY